MSLLPFAATFAVTAGLLTLFLPSKQVLLLGLAAATGIVAEVVLGWWTPAKTPGEVYQIRYLVTALPALCALAAALGYLRPRKAWQWGLAPFLASAVWNVAGPYATVRWGNLGPIPYLFPFYIAAAMAIPAIIAAELAAYVARRQKKDTPTPSNGFVHRRTASLLSAAPCVILSELKPRKEGCAMTTFFRHYRRRGPVNALQMRLQG